MTSITVTRRTDFPKYLLFKIVSWLATAGRIDQKKLSYYIIYFITIRNKNELVFFIMVHSACVKLKVVPEHVKVSSRIIKAAIHYRF